MIMLQVSHAKGKISQLYNLHVLVPAAYILGSDEYHVGVGSTINLVCIIENVSTHLLTIRIRVIRVTTQASIAFQFIYPKKKLENFSKTKKKHSESRKKSVGQRIVGKFLQFFSIFLFLFHFSCFFSPNCSTPITVQNALVENFSHLVIIIVSEIVATILVLTFVTSIPQTFSRLYLSNI